MSTTSSVNNVPLGGDITPLSPQTSVTTGANVGSPTGPSQPPLTAPPKPRSNKEEEEEMIKEVCSNNGINYSKIQNGDEVKAEYLDIFFSGYPRMVGLHFFPYLRRLIIMNQTIHKIEGLVSCTKMTELWICECQVRRIENLESLKHLKKLYLYMNQIKKIENLDHLTDLETLSLNGNKIVNVENLSNLVKLRVLNLAENQIEKIGHTLDGNLRLEELNLSGNKISSLRDLTNLMRLPHLHSLSLKDPMYAPSPVSLLCNYSTHVLYHLQKLTKLDTYDVGSKSLVELAETTVMKKKMYYNMRIKTVKRNLAEVTAKMDAFKQHILNFPNERLRALIGALKEMERGEEAPREDTPDDNESCVSTATVDTEKLAQINQQKLNATSGYTTKLAAIKDRIKRWEKKCSEIESYYTETLSRFQSTADMLINRMVVELESGGNVRFEEGTTSDLWFTSCHDLVLSRFCAADYREHGIVGIKIRRIIRVHNRILRSRFDEKLLGLVDDGESEFYVSNRNVAYKKLLEYLFWMWDPTLPGGAYEPARILEEGFLDAENYRKLGRDGAVPLSNSLSLADRHRMAHLNKLAKGKELSDACPFRYGQLVISKVYLGKSVKALDEKLITQQSYPKIDAVFRPRKMCLSSGSGKGTQGLNPDMFTCECSTRQCEWYIFDHELVLPEYIIEYEYVTKARARSPFYQFNEVLLDNKDSHFPTPPFQEEDKMADSDVLSMEPLPKPRPRLISLTDELLLKLAGVEELEHITVLNLHGNGLTKLKSLQALKSLKRLTVSFNELTRLDDLTHMNIEQIDASFNKICTLEGMKNLHKLRVLDLSWNKLQNTREELSIMRKHMPNLVSLDIRHNNWQKPEDLRLRVVGRLKSLTILNNTQVTETESSAALRVAAGSRISQVSLLTFSRTDMQRPRSLSLMSTAQVLCSTSRHKPEKIGEHDTSWYSKVTAINLDKQHITKLSNLDKLEHLKYASFNGNDLTRIEGLDYCLRLEELSLENNCVTKLEGISKLTQLRRLSLGYNYITSLENTGLHLLVHLHYLALDNNKISSLAGLQSMTSLVELYVGNNQITSIRDVFYLKALTNLVILDMFGNPVANDNENYRLFVIYHLKTLKALDGSAIEATEGNLAKDTFGGRLTPDFVAEKLGHANFQDVRELDLPNNAVRIVDLGPGDLFINLRSINLEHNNLTSFSGLVYLPNLRVLCLNHNHIECVIMSKSKQQTLKSKGSGNNLRNMDMVDNEIYTPVLENLEVLHLGYNNIRDMGALQLSRLISLKALFLQGNEIQKVEGLDSLHDLRELVLDRNKIKAINDNSFINQWNLQELHLEENRIRDLSYINCLENLQRLYLGSNRVQEIGELEKLDGLMNLIELSVVNNAAARRHLHRPVLVYRLKNLMIIDGIPVTDEERAKAELYFMDQQVHVLHPGLSEVVGHFSYSKRENQLTPQGPTEGGLPGIGQYKAQIPVKVTNMQLATSPMWNGGIYYDDATPTDTALQRGGQRQRKTNKTTENGGTALGRQNTMYSQPSTGYGGFGYSSTAGNRAQFYLNQIPYVAAQTSQTAEYVEWLTRMNNARNNRR